jgi:hypothetical protein
MRFVSFAKTMDFWLFLVVCNVLGIVPLRDEETRDERQGRGHLEGH